MDQKAIDVLFKDTQEIFGNSHVDCSPCEPEARKSPAAASYPSCPPARLSKWQRWRNLSSSFEGVGGSLGLM